MQSPCRPDGCYSSGIYLLNGKILPNGGKTALSEQTALSEIAALSEQTALSEIAALSEQTAKKKGRKCDPFRTSWLARFRR
ncbi:MAG: hypothetical protein ACJAYE_001944 [Candidatus Azotimanducaceae bacterium]|jgi:hypothetical protein